jgi:NAD-dependent SIR2 family protein deacetylase
MNFRTVKCRKCGEPFKEFYFGNPPKSIVGICPDCHGDA